MKDELGGILVVSLGLIATVVTYVLAPIAVFLFLASKFYE